MRVHGNKSIELYKLKCLCFSLNNGLVQTQPLIQRCETLRWDIKIISASILLSMSSQSHMPDDFSLCFFSPACQIFECYSVPFHNSHLSFIQRPRLPFIFASIQTPSWKLPPPQPLFLYLEMRNGSRNTKPWRSRLLIALPKVSIIWTRSHWGVFQWRSHFSGLNCSD